MMSLQHAASLMSFHSTCGGIKKKIGFWYYVWTYFSLKKMLKDNAVALYSLYTCWDRLWIYVFSTSSHAKAVLTTEYCRLKQNVGNCGGQIRLNSHWICLTADCRSVQHKACEVRTVTAAQDLWQGCTVVLRNCGFSLSCFQPSECTFPWITAADSGKPR